MIFHIFLQLSALVATAIILYLHFDRKKLNFRDEKLFSMVLFFNVGTLLAETALTVMAYYKHVIGVDFLTYGGIFYGLFVMAELYIINRYLYVRLKSEFSLAGKIINILPMATYLLVAFMYPTHTYFDNNVFIYTGVPINALSLFMIVYAVVAVIRICDKAFFEKKSHKTAIFYGIFVIAAAILLVLINGPLLNGSFLSVIIMLLYCKFDNPEQYLDSATNTFNHETFFIVMEERLEHKRNCSMITFSLREYSMLTEVFGVRAVDNLLCEFMDYFSKFSGKYIFRLETNLFCICVDQDGDSFEVVGDILKRFEENWDIGGLEVIVKPALTYYRSILSFSSPTELEETVTFFAVECRRKEDVQVLTVDDELLSERRKFIEMQRVLERAISRDEIEVFYQPIYSFKTGKYCGLEALARLRAESGELLCADEFINYAEAGYKLIKLGDVIFRKVCRFARSFDFEGMGIDCISINLSKLQCLQDDLAYKLNLTMSEYNIPPYRVRFEVIRPDGAANMISNIRDLAKFGSGITLDKCGIGFSGRLLKNEVKVSIVKMDLTLFKEYIVSAELMKPLEDTIKMLHSLGFEVAISSVETIEQYQVLKQLGIEYIQGYYLSEVLPEGRVPGFLREWM